MANAETKQPIPKHQKRFILLWYITLCLMMLPIWYYSTGQVNYPFNVVEIADLDLFENRLDFKVMIDSRLGKLSPEIILETNNKFNPKIQIEIVENLKLKDLINKKQDRTDFTTLEIFALKQESTTPTASKSDSRNAFILYTTKEELKNSVEELILSIYKTLKLEKTEKASDEYDLVFNIISQNIDNKIADEEILQYINNFFMSYFYKLDNIIKFNIYSRVSLLRD